MIKTKWHIVKESRLRDTRQKVDGHEVIAKFDNADQHFVIDEELFPILKKPQTSASVMALIDAGLARLPYKKMFIEFQISTEFRDFVYLEDCETHLLCHVCYLSNISMRSMIIRPVFTIEFLKNAGDECIRFSGHNGLEQGIRDCCASSVASSVAIALVLLNTRGIEKYTIDPKPLNKARAKKGKPAIPKHSVIHVTKVYRKDGTAISKPSGSKMPMHLRAGHLRKQHFGVKNSEVKQIYIEPCIVNYVEGEELQKKTKVVMK